MKKLLLVLAIAGMCAAPGLASGQQLFDYNGQALVPPSVGNDLTAVGNIQLLYLKVNAPGVTLSFGHTSNDSIIDVFHGLAL